MWLMNNTSYTAIIEGHADEQGTREYNLGLSERRATAVRTSS
jgi:peptidoglycan-associated lipoprotein